MQADKQKEKNIYAATAGYVAYYKQVYRRRPDLEQLSKFIQHRETVLHNICSQKSFDSDKLQWLKKTNGFSWDEKDGNITKIHRSAAFDFEQDWSDRLGSSPIYGGVFTKYEDVFAIAIYRTANTDGDAVCAFFTNDPYVPVFSAVVTNIDKAMKNRELCIALTRKFIALCPNITYPVCDIYQFRKMIKTDGMRVKGKPEPRFVLDQLEKIENGQGLYIHGYLTECIFYRSDKRFINDCTGYYKNAQTIEDVILKRQEDKEENDKRTDCDYDQSEASVYEPFKEHYEEWEKKEQEAVSMAKERQREKTVLNEKKTLMQKGILFVLTVLLGFVTYRLYLNYEQTVDFSVEPSLGILLSFFVLSSLSVAVWVFVSEKLSQCDDEMFLWKIVKVIGLEECIACAGFTVMAEDGSGLITNCIKEVFSVLGTYIRFLNSFFSSQPVVGIVIKVLTVLILVGVLFMGAKEYVLSYISLVAKFIATIVVGYVLFVLGVLLFSDMDVHTYIRGWYIIFAILSSISFFIIYCILKDAPKNQEQIDEFFDEEDYDEEENLSVKEKGKRFFSKEYWDFDTNKRIYICFGIGVILYVVSMITDKISGWNSIVLSALEREYISVNESISVSDANGAVYYFYSTFVAMVMGAVISSGKKKRKNGFVFSINCLLYTFLFQVWGMNWCVDKLMGYYENGIIDSSKILSSFMNPLGDYISGLAGDGFWNTILFIVLVLVSLAITIIVVLAISFLFSMGSSYLIFCIMINVLVYNLVALIMPNVPGVVYFLLTWGINYVAQYYISFVLKECLRHSEN